MKKVGIITINDYNNYGNRLQNYALQEVVKSFDFEVETIVYKPSRKDDYNFSIRIKRLLKLPLHTLFERGLSFTKNKITQIKNRDKNNSRIKTMRQFTIDNIKETSYVIMIDDVPGDLGERYDYFVVGSDQVWNPIFRKCSSIDFLTFAPKYKRIAYAPSFGISKIPQECTLEYTKWLSDMEHLSVREKAGKEIIKELTGRNAELLLDPTAILSIEKWLSIFKPIKNASDKKYLLTYFLGRIPNNILEQINNIASKNNLVVINLGKMSGEDVYAADPGEFLNYIYSSEIFLTDSFHGSLFSILFKKPFIVFNRHGKIPSMNSRIDTLLTKFQLLDRKWENMNGIEDVFSIDYSKIDTILEIERERALNYLKNALNVEVEN